MNKNDRKFAEAVAKVAATQDELNDAFIKAKRAMVEFGKIMQDMETKSCDTCTHEGGSQFCDNCKTWPETLPYWSPRL